MHKPMPQHWMNIGIGRSGFLLCPTLNTKEKRIGVELQMNDEDAKAYFSLLKLEKENVEKEIGHELEWKELPERKSSRIILFKHGVDPLNTAVWPEYRQWFVDKLELFNHVFRNRIKVLDTAALEAFGLDEK
jgi:hypothetical protein